MIIFVLALNIAEEPQKCGVDIAEFLSSFKLNACAKSILPIFPNSERISYYVL